MHKNGLDVVLDYFSTYEMAAALPLSGRVNRLLRPLVPIYNSMIKVQTCLVGVAKTHSRGYERAGKKGAAR